MSETGKVEVVDLGDSPLKSPSASQLTKSAEKPAKKMKQLRLPFAPIQKISKLDQSSKDVPKAVEKAASVVTESEETSKKRKHSEEEIEANKKQALEDDKVVEVKENATEPTKTDVETPKVSTPSARRRSTGKSTPSNKRQKKKASPNVVKETQAEGQSGDVQVESMEVEEVPQTPAVKRVSAGVGTPTASPAVLEEYRRRVKVEIAKISVQVHELRNEMDQAVEAQEFLKAQELKEKISEADKHKEALQESLETSDINKLKDLATPKSTRSSVASTPTNRTRLSTSTDTPTSSAKPDEATNTPTTGATTPKSAGSAKIRKLTPKQLARQVEKEKKKEEKDRQKEEREKQKEEARKAKENEKLKKELERKEKEAQKEQERIEREKEKKAKEEEKERQRLEKEKQKELEKKEREDRNKEKQRQKEMEKEQKEIEKKQQEELEKKKAKEALLKFFVKKPTSEQVQSDAGVQENPNNLTQFRVKKNMKMAPVIRVDVEFKDMIKTVDNAMELQGKRSPSKLYLSELRSGQHKAGRSGRTWPQESEEESSKKSDEDEVEVLDDDEDEEEEDYDVGGDAVVNVEVLPDKLKIEKTRTRAKLLQFHENQRPPYWGTWSKSSSIVGPRRPFARDDHFFDYDYDSDDDWEEEEQGESLSDEENDKEEEEEDDENDNEDDGFFVGHGVLGKDELHPGSDSEDGEFDAELEMKKQKLRAQEFEKKYKKKKTTKLKPKVYGPFWVGGPSDERPKIVLEQLFKVLSPFRAVSLVTAGNTPIPTSYSRPEDSPSAAGNTDGAETPSTASRRLRVFPDDALPDLVRLVHTNTNNKGFLAKEFGEFWKRKSGNTAEDPEKSGNDIPKSKILAKLQEIADYQKFSEPGPMLNKRCWIVKKEILEKLNVTDIEIPNKWEYILETPARANATGTPGQPTEITGQDPKCDTPRTAERSSSSSGLKSKGTPSSLITKFTKVLTEEERLGQLSSPKPINQEMKAPDSNGDKSVTPVAKKRLQPSLISTPECAKNSPKTNGVTPGKKRIQPTLISMCKSQNKEATSQDTSCTGNVSASAAEATPPAKKRITLTTLTTECKK